MFDILQEKINRKFKTIIYLRFFFISFEFRVTNNIELSADSAFRNNFFAISRGVIDATLLKCSICELRRRHIL
jgi:hypothetical protein